jgi:hypothetical protein
MKWNRLFTHLSEIQGSKAIFAVVAIIVTTFVIDISLSRIFSFSASESSFSSRIFIFLIIGIIYTTGQYLILQFVKNKSKHIRAKQQLHLCLIHKAVTIIQYTLTAVIIFFILEMLITSSYSTVLLTVAIGISYFLAMVILVILSKRFFSWFRSNRNLVVGFYGLSSTMLAINTAFTFVLVALTLLLEQPYVYPYFGAPVSPFVTSSSLIGTLNFAYAISSVLSFMLSWVATILILRHYSKSGNIKYWIILSLPLPYFLIQFLPFVPNIISIFSQSDTTIFLLYTFIPTYSKLIGGILFGLAFWAAARNLSRKNIVKDYMIISAYGFVLVFLSNQAILVSAGPYPPFGLATVSFMGLSSYLILVGVYCSAISVSEDFKLRQSIRYLTINESKFLDSIGTAQMEQHIKWKIVEFTKRNQEKIAEETGIQSSLTEEDMTQYLEQALEEVRIQKTKKGNNEQ